MKQQQSKNVINYSTSQEPSCSSFRISSILEQKLKFLHIIFRSKSCLRCDNFLLINVDVPVKGPPQKIIALLRRRNQKKNSQQ